MGRAGAGDGQGSVLRENSNRKVVDDEPTDSVPILLNHKFRDAFAQRESWIGSQRRQSFSGADNAMTSVEEESTSGPASTIRAIWAFSRFLFILFYVIFIPIRVCFDTPKDFDIPLVIAGYVVDVFFIVDLITTIRAPQQTQKPRSFLFDILITIPFDLIALIFVFIPDFSDTAWNVLFVLRLTRVAQGRHLTGDLRTMLSKITGRTNVLDGPIAERITNQFFTVLGAAHLFGCLFFLMSNTSEKHDPAALTWLDTVDGVKSHPVSEQYLYSIYWALVTMMCVGYGDITPQSYYEVILGMVVMLFGFVICARVVGSLVPALAEWVSAFHEHDMVLERQYKYVSGKFGQNKVYEKVLFVV